MFIDTHCHLDSYEETSGETLDSLFKRLQSANDSTETDIRMPEAFFHVACDPKGFENGRILSEKYDFVYTAYGIHPEYVETETDDDEQNLLKYLAHPKCIACGEFGLDYHYGADSRKKQIELFERHLEIGIHSGKPLVLHLREADEDALSVLSAANIAHTKIHIHCFTGTRPFVEKLLQLNAQIFIGFTGIITFKSAANVREAATAVPLDQILLETDSPYMTPVPYRGKPCHSGYIPLIAQKLSEVKEISTEELYNRCRENTRRCYGV